MLRKLNPPQILVLSFLSAIIIGTVLLSLPLATQSGERPPFIDSFFTATSATCVTGLIVRDTGSYFSGFGKTVIFILLQMGGLGIMTFSILFAIILGKKLTIRDDVVIQRTMAANKVQNLATLIKYIVFITLGIELLGATILAVRWMKICDWPIAKTLSYSVFHAVSAFCNAGFSLFPNSLAGFSGDIPTNLTVILLILLGGIGFIVLMELPRLFTKGMGYRFSIQSKVALTISAILILAGVAVFLAAENKNAISNFTIKEKILSAVFQSVTARTAGFNTVNIGGLAPATLCFFIFLMFVGASPGSTGGGIKTCTLGVLAATAHSMLKNRDRVSLFKRTIPKEVVRKAFVVLFLASTWIFTAALLLAFTEHKQAGIWNHFFLKILFEATSAFGTVGLSTGITPLLTWAGKFVIILTMFIGRVGPLTLALAVALQHEKVFYVYPEEKIMIG